MENSINYIEGERIYLRKIKIEDLDDKFLEWYEDEELMKYFTNSRTKITKETTINFILEGEKNKNSYVYVIIHKQNNECIGTINLGPINILHKISDLTVLIGNRKYHGQGLAKEAIKLGNKLAFEFYDLRRLYGGMYERNISSIKAYTQADWVIEGKLKGYYWENDTSIDRILVGCFNPKYFDKNNN